MSPLRPTFASVTCCASVLAVATIDSAMSWQLPAPAPVSSGLSSAPAPRRSAISLDLFGKKGEEESATATLTQPVQENSAEDTTEKYGLEVGLFQSLRSDDGGESAKSLLKKYGIAYLATSIPLALVSFGICYVLVDSGIDVASLLAKVGIEGAATEKAGTFAIAYAAHKAASPIRFPPTVLLTPIVAKLIGKEPESEDAELADQ